MRPRLPILLTLLAPSYTISSPLLQLSEEFSELPQALLLQVAVDVVDTEEASWAGLSSWTTAGAWKREEADSATHFRNKVAWFLLALGSFSALVFALDLAGASCARAVRPQAAGQGVYAAACLLTAVAQGMLLTVSLPLAAELGYGPAASGVLTSATSLGGLVAQVIVFVWPSALARLPHSQLRAGTTATLFLQALFHASFVIALCLPLPKVALWYSILVLRSAGGFFAALSCLTSGFLAMALTPAGELLDLQTVIQGSYGVGQCLGSVLSSVALSICHLSGEEKGMVKILEGGSAPVMLLVLLLVLLLAANVLLVPSTVKLEHESAVESSVNNNNNNKAETRPVTQQEALNLGGYERKRVFQTGLTYNFERTFSVASIEVATTMISQVEFGFSAVTTGWIFGVIAMGSVLANVLVGCTPSDVDYRVWVMLCFAFVGVLTTPFIMDIWPWWSLYIADMLMMTMTNAANGISDGVALLASGKEGEDGLSKQSYINQKMLLMAVAKVLAAPFARGLLPWLGRDGYAALQLLITCAGFFGIWKIYSTVSSRPHKEAVQ